MKPHRGEARLSNAQAAMNYQDGLAAFETGRYAEAIELLSSIAAARNLSATLARFYLGQAHFKQGIADLEAGRLDAAKFNLTEARRINPDSTSLSRYLVSCHLGQGRFDLAAAELERQVAAGSRESTLPIRRAHALARDGHRLEALDTLEKAIASAPHRADLRFELGLMCAAAEDYPAATTHLIEAAKRAPLDPRVRQNLAMCHGATGRYREAVTELTTAQRLAPHDAHIALLLSWAAQAAHESQTNLAAPAPPPQPAGDLAALERVILDDPEFVEAFLSLPASDVDGSIFAMLSATLERALERHAEYADLHYHCSRVYERMGRTDAAIERAKDAARINPRYIQALVQLARLYAQTRRDADAIERLREAISIGAAYPDVHFLLGELHRRGGDREEACSHYRRALDLNENFGPARAALAAVLAS